MADTTGEDGEAAHDGGLPPSTEAPSKAGPPSPAKARDVADDLAAREATENERAARGSSTRPLGKSAPVNTKDTKAADEPPQLSPVSPQQMMTDEIGETLDATVAEGQAAPAFETPEEKRYDPVQYQDATRSYIAYWLLLLLTLLVIGGFSLPFIIKPITFENIKSILELILGPIVALVSAATGFYFGAQQPGKKP